MSIRQQALDRRLRLLARRLNAPSGMWFGTSRRRQRAAVKIQELGPNATGIVPMLTEVAEKDRDSDVRYQVIKALGHIGEQASNSEPVLLRILNDSQEATHIRRASLYAISRISPINYAERIVPLLLQPNNSDYNNPLEYDALDALKEMGTKAKKAIPNLIRFASLEQSNFVRVEQALKVVSSFGSEAVPYITKTFLNMVQDDVRPSEEMHYIAEALATIGQSARPAILAWIEFIKPHICDADSYDCVRIQRAFAKLNDFSFLLEAYKNVSDGVEQPIQELLSGCLVHAPFEFLEGCLKNENENDCIAALAALTYPGSINKEKVHKLFPYVCRLSQSGSPLARTKGLAILQQRLNEFDVKSYDLLLTIFAKALSESNENIKREARLGYIKVFCKTSESLNISEADVVEIVRELLVDDQPRSFEVALNAIRCLRDKAVALVADIVSYGKKIPLDHRKDVLRALASIGSGAEPSVPFVMETLEICVANLKKFERENRAYHIFGSFFDRSKNRDAEEYWVAKKACGTLECINPPDTIVERVSNIFSGSSFSHDTSFSHWTSWARNRMDKEKT